jgi:ABC-type amino acid transport substrate-binding protein
MRKNYREPMMKKAVALRAFVLSVMFLTMILSLSPAVAQQLKGDSWAMAQKNGKGTITVTYYETAGLVVKNGSGQLDGMCVELLQQFVDYVQKTKKVALKVQYAGNGENFKSFYNNVKAGSGGVFGMGNVTVTEERKKEIKFSVPFMTNIAVFMTHEQVPSFAKLAEMPGALNGKTAYIPKGTTHEKRMLELKAKYFPGMKVVYTTSSTESMEKMLQDKNGFCYQDLALYLEAMKRNNTIKRHPVADRSGEKFGFIMPLNSDWAPVFDEFLTNLKKDAKYKQIIAKHLGSSAAKMLEKVSN